ncbi:MAG: acetamidase/formamidase family protein, partial [Anaerolineaceae bacterium]
GPVYIEGVQPGDVLKIEIRDIRVDEQSVVVCMPGSGAIGDIIRQTEAVVMPIRDGQAVYKEKVRLPIDPMIGVIGVAPAGGEEIPTGVPDYHGGNMDCTAIRKGATLYLTANVEGALLGCGDLHAVMGDGEIIVTGAETDGQVHLNVSVSPLKDLPTPFLENDEMVAVIFSALTIDEAVDGAVHRMTRFLTEFAGIPLNDAGMLMSLAGQLKFCQVVDPKRTVRFEFPKRILADYGYTFAG